jgi:hypothetical protein
VHRTRNVTSEEWEIILKETCIALQKLWPGIEIDSNSLNMGIRTDACSGELFLRNDSSAHKGEMHMTPVVRIGCGTALNGDLSIVETGLQDYRTTMDILHRAIAMLGHHCVWFGATCFCDFCSGKGTSRGESCTYCEGTGARPTSHHETGAGGPRENRNEPIR